MRLLRLDELDVTGLAVLRQPRDPLTLRLEVDRVRLFAGQLRRPAIQLGSRLGKPRLRRLQLSRQLVVVAPAEDESARVLQEARRRDGGTPHGLEGGQDRQADRFGELARKDYQQQRRLEYYDDYGLVHNVFGADNRLMTEDIYDGTYTFPEEEINFLGHVTEYAFCPLAGRVESITDPNIRGGGQCTKRFEYDAFGFLTKES